MQGKGKKADRLAERPNIPIPLPRRIFEPKTRVDRLHHAIERPIADLEVVDNGLLANIHTLRSSGDGFSPCIPRRPRGRVDAEDTVYVIADEAAVVSEHIDGFDHEIAERLFGARGCADAGLPDDVEEHVAHRVDELDGVFYVVH